MSRIGKKPVNIVIGVTVDIDGNSLLVKGSKGELTCLVDPSIKVEVKENQIVLVRNSEQKIVKSKHGLYRSLINNMVIGVSEGYRYNMILQGIGYRVQQKGKNLEFSLGYSHSVPFGCPEGITFGVEGQDKFFVSGIDKQLVGETCAQIKKLRKRDAYKGKGIHFENEQIRKKPGKSIKK